MFLLSYFLPLWLSFTSLDSKPHCEVVSYKTSIEIEEDGTLVVNKNIDIKINDRQGDWVTEKSIWYNGKKNRVLSLEAKITDKYGKIVKTLKKKDITSRSAIGGSSWYTDDFVKEFQLLHHEYPYHLQYSYTQKFDEYLEIEDWSPHLYYSTPTKHAQLEVINKSNIELYIWESDSNIVKTKISEQHVKWECHNLSHLEKETNGPPLYELTPRVIIRPDHFSYGAKGSNQSWTSFGDWSLDLQTNCNDLSIKDQEDIKALVANLDTDTEKIKVLYNKMQDEVRYIYVGVEYGGLQSYSASYVSQNKYGDCKALTTYMQSALAAIGIESYRATVYAGEDPVMVNNNLPGHQSNHVILCVPLEQDTVWLENTSNAAPYDYLGSFTQNRKALVMKSGSSQLIDLPSFDIQGVKSNRNFNLDMDVNELKGIITGHFKGEKYDDLISFKYGLSAIEKKNALKKHAPHLLTYDIERGDRNQKTVNLHAEVLYVNKIKSYGPNKAIFLPNSDLPTLEKPEDRSSELRIRIPKNLNDSIYININPEEFTQIELPKDTLVSIINNPDFQYQLMFSRNEGQVLCLRKIQYPIHTFATGKPYQDFFDFIEQIKIIERKTSFKLRP